MTWRYEAAPDCVHHPKAGEGDNDPTAGGAVPAALEELEPKKAAARPRGKGPSPAITKARKPAAKVAAKRKSPAAVEDSLLVDFFPHSWREMLAGAALLLGGE